MANPYDHNPFKTDDREIKNERDANRALRDTLLDIAKTRVPDSIDWEELTDPFGEFRRSK